MHQPFYDPLLNRVADLKAHAAAGATAITAADIAAARVRDRLARTHPFAHAVIDSHTTAARFAPPILAWAMPGATNQLQQSIEDNSETFT